MGYLIIGWLVGMVTAVIISYLMELLLSKE